MSSLTSLRCVFTSFYNTIEIFEKQGLSDKHYREKQYRPQCTPVHSSALQCTPVHSSALLSLSHLLSVLYWIILFFPRHSLGLGIIQHSPTGQPTPGYVGFCWSASARNTGWPGSSTSFTGTGLLPQRGETFYTSKTERTWRHTRKPTFWSYA